MKMVEATKIKALKKLNPVVKRQNPIIFSVQQ